MYEKLLKKLEGLFEIAVMRNINYETIKYAGVVDSCNDLADLIVKIKTIQTMDKSMMALEDLKD